MASWSDVETAAPAFAALVRRLLDRHVCKILAGRAVFIGAQEDPSGDAFRAELDEVVWTGLNEAADRLVVWWWRAGDGMHRVERE